MERKRKIKKFSTGHFDFFTQWIAKLQSMWKRSRFAKRHYQSISQRWVVNSIGLITLVLVLLVLCIGYGMRQFYFSAAITALENEASICISKIEENSSNSSVNIKTYIRNQVEHFENKDQIEMMLISHDGSVVATSSGFPYDLTDDLLDYQEALSSNNGSGSAQFELSEGEMVLAYTQLIPAVNSEYSAVRYVVSLEPLKQALLLINLALIGGLVLIVGLLLYSNSYFIRSIVYPVKELTHVARGFATGDLDMRIVKHSDDEIGQLCDVLNFMADEMQKTDRMQNEFISSVSHELRTPLTAIKGWGETMLNVGPEDQALMQSGMQVILKETERLSTMVEELLDFSRIQNGNFTLTKTKMDLLAELDDALLIYTERARRDGKMLVCNEPEYLPYVFGDCNRIKQVFINVIDNALKYSDAGGVVTIDVKQREQYAVVCVSDTGCGIDPKDLPRIKEKFFKANVTRRGSGIGLAVADEIVQLHQGALEIESEPGVGTTVTIKLPMIPRDIERKAEALAQEERTLEHEQTESEA